MNKFILPTLIMTLAVAPFSWAKDSHHEKLTWAKVINVQPIFRTIKQRIPQEHCWNEPIRYEHHRQGSQSYTGTIIGGIIGGAIGSKVGHNKKNKKVGAVIGTILGASVGHDLSNRNHSSLSVYQNERRCQVSNEIRYTEKVIGYHVWYRLHGNEYTTRMNHHPGKKIKVRVTVKPY